jgi:NodT family efflux transporter outer membrane factor (OMF) lipoprotein
VGRARLLVLIVIAAILSGCTVGPNFTRPPSPAVVGYDTVPIPLPPAGERDPAQRFADGAPVAERWWALFESPALDDTIALALAASPTLATAQATLAQAREAVLVARANYYPQVDLVATGSWEHAQSLKGRSSRGSTTSSGSTLVTDMFNIGPALTYSPDLFGHNRRLVEQQAALAENQRYQAAAAYLALTADAATQAITIASTQAQIKAVEDIIAADVRNLELVRIAFDAGSVARTDVLSAESQLAGDRTLLPPLQQQLAVARHALAVVVGKLPAEWSPPEFDLDALRLPAELPVTVPSELVHGRPDILSAEAQLHAASAAIGVATAQLYPSITISPALTLQAVASGGPVAAPSILAGFVGSIAQPLFHGGALRAQQRAAIDAYDAQRATYRQTVLVAFGQVADVLRALQHDADLLRAEDTALTASEASLKLAQEAYAAGRGTLVQVLDAQRLYAQAVLGYARARGQRYLDTVLLFEAMGGASEQWAEERHGFAGALPSR